jgi:hypothetical protein
MQKSGKKRVRVMIVAGLLLLGIGSTHLAGNVAPARTVHQADGPGTNDPPNVVQLADGPGTNDPPNIAIK